MSPAINEGIVELARRGRLRSASCVANGAYLEHRLDELVASGVEIYLHLNFTYGDPLTPSRRRIFHPHKTLLMKSVLGLLPEADVDNEIVAQFERLGALGVPVCGANGHHHVHLLPGLSGPLQKQMLERGMNKLLVLDDPCHSLSHWQTRLFLRGGGLREGVVQVRCGYLLPQDLKTSENFFNKIDRGILPLLVHPALWNDFAESGMTDPLQEQRVNELKTIVEYLNA